MVLNSSQHHPTIPTCSQPSPKTPTSSVSSTSGNPAKRCLNSTATRPPSTVSSGAPVGAASSHPAPTTALCWSGTSSISTMQRRSTTLPLPLPPHPRSIITPTTITITIIMPTPPRNAAPSPPGNVTLRSRISAGRLRARRRSRAIRAIGSVCVAGRGSGGLQCRKSLPRKKKKQKQRVKKSIFENACMYVGIGGHMVMIVFPLFSLLMSCGFIFIF